jgi:ABC-type bacteriocin/lantibiotic exporter with double-glycine peptidase domain
MVLSFHGVTCSEAEIRQLLGTQPGGTRARNLMAVTSLGLDVRLGSSNLLELRGALAAGLAPIIFVDTGPLNYWTIDCAHVVVLVGIDDTSAFLNDPFFDTGPQQASLTGLLQAWALNEHLAAILQPRP